MQISARSSFLYTCLQMLNRILEMHFSIWAFILPIIFFSPYLLTGNPQFNFFGDVAILYFPQFVEGYRMAESGALVGIDFLTGNGSTAYFLRPNIPVYYPIYQAVYLLFNFESIEELARAFVVIMCAHSIIAAYYCLRIGKVFFHMDQRTALFFSVLYFGAIANVAFAEPPFYYVAALFPFLLYFSLRSIEKSGWWRIVLYSFPYTMVFLSGYLPLDVNAVLVAILFTATYYWQTKDSKANNFRLILIRLLAPAALAGFVVLPLFIAMFFYHHHVTGVVNEVWSAAHQFSLESRDLFSLLSRSFEPSNLGTGAPYVILGIAPVSILVLAYSNRNKHAQPVEKIIPLSMVIFFFYLLLAFGCGTGLPDIFYFITPVIGRMHMYGRYLLVASFFFYLVVAISFNYLVKIRDDLVLDSVLVVLFIVMLVAEGYSQIAGHIKWVDLDLLVIEIFMVFLMLLSLSSRHSFYVYAGAIGVAFLGHASNFNYPINTFGVDSPSPYRSDVAFSPERREALNNFFTKNSNKYLIKYVDVSPNIEKPGGLMLNYPWLVSDKLKISNYMGYEPHMAVDRDYMALFPHPYYGSVSFPWVLGTGADFIIYNTASENYVTEQKDWIDHSVSEFDIGHGYKAAKLLEASRNLGHLQDKNSNDFDNGIVHVSNAKGTSVVTEFETDLVSRVSFQVDSSLPATIRYQLFPNKMMVLYIDGQRTTLTYKDGLLDFTLPPGQHEVKYLYDNWMHTVFIVIYWIYFAIFSSLLVWRISIEFRSFRLKCLNQTMDITI